MTQEQVNEAFAKHENIRHPEDAERIAHVIFKAFGVTVSDFEASIFWDWRSSNMAAGWLMLRDDHEIISNFRSFVREHCESFRQHEDEEDLAH